MAGLHWRRIAVGVDRAFEVFTNDFDRIKPREHNMLGEAIAQTVLEPKAGGRLSTTVASTARPATRAESSPSTHPTS